MGLAGNMGLDEGNEGRSHGKGWERSIPGGRSSMYKARGRKELGRF